MSQIVWSEELATLDFEKERAALDAAIDAFEEPLAQAPGAPKEAKAKWLLASCLQKAIRQGDADAAQWAVDAMLPNDRAYALHRMAVIAIEDIGVANLPLVLDFMFTGIRKAWYEAHGTRKSAIYFARALAESPKDRSACDLPLLALGLPPATVANAVNAPTDKLREALLAPKVDLRAKALGLWSALGGQKIKGAGIPADKHDPDAFLSLCHELGATPKMLWLLDQSIKIQSEWHPVALGLLAAQAVAEGAIIAPGFISPTAPLTRSLASVAAAGQEPLQAARRGGMIFPGRSANGFFLSGLDGHCREGRNAIDACFLKHPDLKKTPFFAGLYGEQLRERAGSLLFAFEGGRVNAPMDYPSARRVFASSLLRGAQRQNMPEPLLREVPAFFEKFLPALDDARAKSLSKLDWAKAPSAPSASSQPKP